MQKPTQPPRSLLVPGFLLVGVGTLVALWPGMNGWLGLAFASLGVIVLVLAYLGPRLEGTQKLNLWKLGAEINVGAISKAGAKAEEDLAEGKVTLLHDLEAGDVE